MANERTRPGAGEHHDETADGADRFRSLAESVPAVTYVAEMGPPYTTFYVSPQIEHVVGYSQQEWLHEPDTWTRAIHAEDRDRVLGSLAEAARRGDPWSQEYRLLDRSGRVVWVRDECMPLRDEDGQPTYWRGALVDITRRKQAEAAIGRFETEYRTLVEQLPVVVYVDTPSDLPVTLYMSPQVRELTGYGPERFLEDPNFWVGCLHPDDRERMVEANRSFARTGHPRVTEYRMIAADGRVVWVRDQTTAIDDPEGKPLLCQGVWLDITDRKAAEEGLRRSEAKYRALVEEIPAVVYTVAPDDESTTLYVSPQVEGILGYTQQEWLDQPDIWTELLHPDDREPTLAARDLANESGSPWSAEYRLIASDGRHVWFRDEASLVRDPAGTPLFWHGVRMDITDRKLAEEALRLAREELEERVRERTAELAEANEFLMLEVAERRRAESELRRAETRYRALVEQIPGAIVYVWKAVAEDEPLAPDPYVSPQIAEVLGFTPEEWDAETSVWVDRLHPADRDRLVGLARRSNRTGEPFEAEYRVIAKDGRIVWLYDQGVLIERDEHGRPALFHGVMYDVSERHRNEERLRRAEERYRSLVEQLPGAVVYIWEVRAGQRVHPEAYVSPQIERLLGYTQEEWYRDPGLWTRRCHPEDLARVTEATRRSEETGEPFELEYRYLHRDGRVVWVRDQAELIERDEEGRPRFFHGVMFDVSERRASEERLRLADEELRRLNEQLELRSERQQEELDEARGLLEELVRIGPGIIFRGTLPDRTLTYISPNVERSLGYRPQDIVGVSGFWFAHLHPEDREAILVSAEAALGRGAASLETVARVRHRDGQYLWFHTVTRYLTDDDGSPTGFCGAAIPMPDAEAAFTRVLAGSPVIERELDPG